MAEIWQNIQNIVHHFSRHLEFFYLLNSRPAKGNRSCQDLFNKPELSHFRPVELELWLLI